MEPLFLSLPLELQTEILYCLEFDDVLKVRQVCRALSSATRQRSLWMSILRNPPPPMDLYSYLVDKNLDMCTSSDLEAIVTDCLRRHTSWGDPSAVRVRSIDATHWRRDSIVILPGGRWAIMFSGSGDAFAFDLHTSGDTYQHSPLFPGCTSKLPWELTAVVQTPEAGFQTELKMALFTSAGPDKHRIQVWLLRPSYDAIGHVDGLKAELLSSFSGHPPSWIYHYSISGSFLGCLIKIKDSDDVYCVMIDWAKAHGREDWETLPKYVLPFGNRCLVDHSVFFLLPNDTLVTTMELRNSYEVWDLRSIVPVLRLEDAAEPQPIGRGSSVHANSSQRVSLPVFCHSDGRTRITTSGHDSEFCKRSIISVHGVKDATLFPIPPIDEYESRFQLRGRLHGIDKFIDFENHNHVTTVKAARWSALPHPCSITSFQSSVKVMTWTSRMHVDSFSGVVMIGDEDYRKRVITDFPLLHSSVS